MNDTDISKTYTYESPYGTYQLRPWVNTYANNGNLALGFDYLDKESDEWEPFCYATVNIAPLGYLESAIDVNDNGLAFMSFLEKNGFGQQTDLALPSGYCVFPVFRFNEERIQQIDPAFFAKYQKAYGMDKTPLDAQIRDADARSKSSFTETPGKAPVR